MRRKVGVYVMRRKILIAWNLSHVVDGTIEIVGNYKRSKLLQLLPLPLAETSNATVNALCSWKKKRTEERQSIPVALSFNTFE